MYRVEDKYICTEKDMLILQSRMKIVLKPDLYSDNGAYRVTSLYFDDYDDTGLLDSEDGVSFRRKYRMRIYNGSSDLIKLEVKYKSYNRVFKRSRTISPDMAEMLIRGQIVNDSDDSMDNPVTLFNLAISQNLLRPKVVVEYDRSAFIFSPGNVRITFDRNIRMSNDVSGFLEDRCIYSAISEADRILEVKYDEFLPGFVAGLLESGNMIQTSYSKYRLSRQQSEV